MSTPNPTPFAPCSKVVIRFNPHDDDASDIVGKVLRFHPGGGHIGCDLADVQYEDPRDGTVHVLPFGTHNLDVGDPESLLERAARHDEQAAQLRAMARRDPPDDVATLLALHPSRSGVSRNNWMSSRRRAMTRT